MTEIIMHTLFISNVNQQQHVLIYDDSVEMETSHVSPERLYQQHQAVLRKKRLTKKAQTHFIKAKHPHLQFEDIKNPNVKSAEIETNFKQFIKKLKAWKD